MPLPAHPKSGDGSLRLPEMAALVSGDDHEARPDAVADAWIGWRGDPNLVDGPAPAAMKRGDNTLLAIQEAVESLCEIGLVGGFEVDRRPGTNARRRLQNPREQASPEIHFIGRIQLRLAGARGGDHLLPHREVGVRADVQMLQALRRGPGSRSGRGTAQILARRLDQRLKTRGYIGELVFQFVECRGPGHGHDCRVRLHEWRGFGETCG